MSRRHSRQTVAVLAAMAADPAELALRLRARARGRPQGRLAVPDPDAPGRPRAAREQLGDGPAGRPPAAPSLPPDGRRRDGGRRGRGARAGPGRRAPRPERRMSPEALLRWAVRLLPAHRREWGRAMEAELAGLDAGRWRFALSCSRGVLRPARDDRPALPWLLVAGAAAAAVWLLAGHPGRLGPPRGDRRWSTVLGAVAWFARPARAVAAAGFAVLALEALIFLHGLRRCRRRDDADRRVDEDPHDLRDRPDPRAGPRRGDRRRRRGGVAGRGGARPGRPDLRGPGARHDRARRGLRARAASPGSAPRRRPR